MGVKERSKDLKKDKEVEVFMKDIVYHNSQDLKYRNPWCLEMIPSFHSYFH